MTPTSRLLFFVFAASLPVVMVPVSGLPTLIAVLPTLAVLVLAVADRLAGSNTPFEIRREVRRVLSVGTPNGVELVVRNLSRRTLTVEVADEPPAWGSSEPDGPVLSTLMTPFLTAHLKYDFTPERRGRFNFTGVQIRHVSRLAFWHVRRRFDLAEEVQIFPNIEALHRFELLARVNSLSEMGFRSVRMRGDGTEFERLREYRQGDEPKRVDWKATARLRKLIVREMGQERNQNVLFMIDMGRMMRQTTAGLSHFDYALNTAIILGHIAQQRGDNVGVVIFSDRVKRFVPLNRGRTAVDQIVRSGYDIEPEPVATNYSRAFRHVMTHVRKRSLLLLFTHLVPGEDRRLIRSFMQMLGRKHLPLCLFFREPELEREVLSVPVSTSDAFHRAAAADILLERHEGLYALRHAGVMAVDALPGEFSAAAVGHYLDIKARNLL